MGALGRLLLDPLPADLFRADALQDAPALVQGSSRPHYILDLIAPREWPAIEKDNPIRTPLEQLPGSFEHDVQTKIILPRRVLNFVRQEKRVPDLVFAEHAPAAVRGQFAGECSFASAGNPRHEDDHQVIKHLPRMNRTGPKIHPFARLT